ncbi:EAL domain-containing protein (putative c-di-GMP-specific phosphodiesterase class I) [Amorphus suaedae]
MNVACEGCRNGEAFDLPFAMAFQPIVDLPRKSIFGHEALVRGVNGESAGAVLSQLTPQNRYAFDQKIRVRAIEMATRLGMAASGQNLSINFLPNAVYEPAACIRQTLIAARRTGFPLDQIIFEFTEDESVDVPHVVNILETYRSIGFRTAIDDFGAGQAGLSLLARFQPDIVKIDMDLVRDIDIEPARRTVLKHVLRMLDEFSIQPICEGVETRSELDVLVDLGVELVQGYLIARPAFEALADPTFPA